MIRGEHFTNPYKRLGFELVGLHRLVGLTELL